MKKIRPAYLIFIVCILIVLCALSLSSQVLNLFVHHHTVVLTNKGFSPKWLTVHRNDTVTFKSTMINKPFWPASNSHPTHTIYPQFDPKRPVSPDSSWSFTFDSDGVWRYHDHISPEFTGTITVLSPGSFFSKALPCSQKNISLKVKQQCWEDVLSDVIEQKGIKDAFVIFTKLYKTDPDFVTTGCHLYAHRMGDAFYRDYAIKMQTLVGLELPPETVNCDYGFFHGLFEHFFRRNSDIQLVQTICDDLDKRYNKTIPLIRINCFHGAGHGLIVDPPDYSLWGDLEKIITTPLAKCERISSVAAEQDACMDGVFNVVSSWMIQKEYTMNINTNDPFWLCKRIKSRYQESCYYEQIMVINSFDNRDVATISKKFIEPISDKRIAQIVMFSLTASLMQRDIELLSQMPLVISCRNVAVYLQERCLQGIVNGFRSHGEPGREYIKAKEFCQLSELNSAEKNACYAEFIKSLWFLYSKEKVVGICRTLEMKYIQMCIDNTSLQ